MPHRDAWQRGYITFREYGRHKFSAKYWYFDGVFNRWIRLKGGRVNGFEIDEFLALCPAYLTHQWISRILALRTPRCGVVAEGDGFELLPDVCPRCGDPSTTYSALCYPHAKDMEQRNKYRKNPFKSEEDYINYWLKREIQRIKRRTA